MAYMPQWRARAGAQAILSRDDVKVWKKGHLHFIGIPQKGPRGGEKNRRALVSATDWPTALRLLKDTFSK